MKFLQSARRKSSQTEGLTPTLAAFLFWGLAIIYWKQVRHVPPREILIHRVIWSLVFMTVILTVSHGWNYYRMILQKPKQLLRFGFTALLLGTNWLTFIWAVNAGFVVECSLGYFINPLVNVVLGVIFFRERLGFWQKISILLATAGVLNLTFNYGRFPWIALTLALTFGLYGLLRKQSPIASIPGFGIETALLLPLAIGYGIYLIRQQQLVFGADSWITDGLLILAGPVTTLPLLWFNQGIQRLPLSTVGLIMYLTPSCMFLLGVWVYHEPFTLTHGLTFGCIWAALVIFAWESRRPQATNR